MLSLDLSLAKCILTRPEALAQAQEAGITPDMLYDEGKKVVTFALGFLRDHGKLPAVETVEQETEIPMDGDVPEPTGYYVGEAVKRWKGTTVAAGIKRAVAALEKGDPDASLREVLDAAGRVKAVGAGQGGGLLDLTDERCIQTRIAEYERMKTLGGVPDGIPTMWPSINRVTGGIHDDELWVILGRLKSTKTWQLSALAENAWREGWDQGRRVLLVSEEMGVQKVARRWDAIHSHLPYGDFKRGQLATQLEEQWRKDLEDAKGRPPFWVAGRQRVKNVPDLELLIEELAPAITFVDGAYFLGEGGDSKWESSAKIVDQIQALVQRRHHPVVVTWQFNRKVKTGAAAGMAEDVAWAYELVQAADVALGVFRNEDLVRKKQAIIQMIVTRESEHLNPLLIECDFDTQSFKEIGEVQDEGDVAANPTEQSKVSY